MEYLVLVESMSSEWHISQYVVFYWKTCLTGRHVLLEDMFFMWIFIVRGHVLRFKMSHILLQGLPYWKPYIT